MDFHTLLLADDVKTSINDNMDYLLDMIPEIRFMIGFKHKNPSHHLDVWKHTLLALSLSSCDFDVRLALLLHDIGKPFSYQDGAVRHYRNHQVVSSQMAEIILERLGFNEDYVKYISYLIRHHDYPISDKQINENYDICLKLYEIQRCDALAHHPDKLEIRKKYLSKVKQKLFEKE